MNRAQRKRERADDDDARSEIWKPFLAGGGDEVIRSLFFLRLKEEFFAFPGSLRTGTGRIAYGVWGRPKECEGIAKRNQSKKRESDKEGSELRQSRGSRIRDERIKGGGGGGSRGTLEQASYRGSR